MPEIEAVADASERSDALGIEPRDRSERRAEGDERYDEGASDPLEEQAPLRVVADHESGPEEERHAEGKQAAGAAARELGRETRREVGDEHPEAEHEHVVRDQADAKEEPPLEDRREENNNDQPGGERPFYQFRGLLNFANDACCFDEQVSVDPVTGLPPNALRHFRTNNYGLFAQDDWKVLPTLTINLGLRWEYFTPVTEVSNLLSNYVAGSQGFINGSVQSQKQLYDADTNNFGPRVGVAWSPSRYQGKIVFRGGFGLLYNRYFGVIFDNVRQNTPFTAEVNTCCFFDNGTNVGPPATSNIQYFLGSSRQANSFPANTSFANGIAPDGALCADPGCTTITKVDLFGALPKEPNPYVYVFSFETQAELMKDLVFKMGYQGSRSRKLVRTIDINRLQPGDTFDTDPLPDEFQTTGSNGDPCGPTNPTCLAPHAVGNNRFKSIFMPLPDVNASYDAGIFQLTRRFSHGLQIDGIFTWAHAIDTSSFEVGFQQTDPSNQELDRADSDFDVRRNFVLSALWELPIFRTHGLAHTVLGGWTISGIMSKHSGFPFSGLIGSCDTNNDRKRWDTMVQISNVTDSVALYNFQSIFVGTRLVQPRTASVKLRWWF